MIGAYSCWLVQQALAQLAPQWLAFYPLVALPVAFLVTAGIGMALERTIIRHLYGRPLETLLATGDQPDAYPAGADDVWRAERRGGESRGSPAACRSCRT